jgi:hypothetical protein
MTKLNDIDKQRAWGFLQVFHTDLLGLIHDSWVKTGLPIGGCYVRSGKLEDLPESGLLLPMIIQGAGPLEFAIIKKFQSGYNRIGAAIIQGTFNNDYRVLCIGIFSDCILLSEVITKAKSILLNVN